MPARTDRGTGRPDQKMSRSDKEWKRARFSTGTRAHQHVQARSNAKRRQRDRTERRSNGLKSVIGVGAGKAVAVGSARRDRRLTIQLRALAF